MKIIIYQNELNTIFYLTSWAFITCLIWKNKKQWKIWCFNLIYKNKFIIANKNFQKFN